MSFARVCATFLALATVTQATLLITSVNIVGNGTSSVTFTSTDIQNDPPSFTIELVNPSFHKSFAVGNNVPITLGNFTFETPSIIPGPNYSIQLVNNSNAEEAFAMSPPFTVTENDVTSSSSKQSASATATLPPSLSAVSSTPVATIQSITPSGVTQPSSSSNSGSSPSSSSTTPPSTASNPVFTNSGAIALQAPLGLLLVGIAFAFF